MIVSSPSPPVVGSACARRRRLRLRRPPGLLGRLRLCSWPPSWPASRPPAPRASPRSPGVVPRVPAARSAVRDSRACCLRRPALLLLALARRPSSPCAPRPSRRGRSAARGRFGQRERPGAARRRRRARRRNRPGGRRGRARRAGGGGATSGVGRLGRGNRAPSRWGHLGGGVPFGHARGRRCLRGLTLLLVIAPLKPERAHRAYRRTRVPRAVQARPRGERELQACGPSACGGAARARPRA